jgi:uncharacterized membrane protein
MYKVIGGDQKQYGPVTAEEVQHWIADGRLNAQSLAWAEGATDWKPLGSFPEFADALRVKATLQPPPGATLPPGMAEAYGAETLSRPSQVHIGSCLERSWALVTGNFGLLFGTTCIVWAISFGCNLIPLGVGSFAYWLLRGVLYGGMYLVFLKRIRGEDVSIGTLFSGFETGFVQLFLTGVVSGILSMLAMFCCLILPGIYLVVAWIFSPALVADKRLEFWSGMELSRKIVTRIWFQIFGLMLVASLPMIITGLLAGTKVAIAIAPIIEKAVRAGQPDPVMLRAAIEQIIATSGWMFIVTNVVFVLNYPFLIGALAHAYEDLFGPRRAPSA